jgi:hypothetical protein
VESPPETPTTTIGLYIRKLEGLEVTSLQTGLGTEENNQRNGPKYLKNPGSEKRK